MACFCWHSVLNPFLGTCFEDRIETLIMKRLYFLAIVIVVIYLNSCSPVYYIPNTQNVPLLSHEKEYNISMMGNTTSLELQTSVSPVNHLGIQLNSSYFIPQFMDNGDRGRGYMIDGGAGYYKAFGFDDKFIFEAYAVGGIGHAYNGFMYRDSITTGGSISTNVARYGVQPIIGFKSKYIDVAVSSRFVALSYFNTTGDLVYNGVRQTDYLSDHSNSFLIEPAFTFRAGSDFFKFQLQVQGSFNTLYSNFYQNNSMITVGIVLSPNRYRNIFKKEDANNYPVQE